LNGLALCSGIGGLELGLHIALDGYRTVCHVEREAFCASDLVEGMEDPDMGQAPVWDDVADFDGRRWRGVVDIITAGYPCQPFSVAGCRRGVEDPRHIWPDIANIIRAVEPSLVFLENVPGHLKLGFDVVAGELSEMGYRVAATLLTAQEIGASHKRERMFVLAHHIGDNLREQSGRRHDGKGGPCEAEPSCAGKDLAHAEADGHSRNGEAWGRRAGSADVGNHVAGGPELAERQGRCVAGLFPAPWPPSPADLAGWKEALQRDPTVEPAICGMVDGDASRVDRLRALGNAVVPFQAAVAFVCLGIELGVIE